MHSSLEEIERRFAQLYPEVHFGGYAVSDGTFSFYFRVNALLRPDHVVLDLGCGSGVHRDADGGMAQNLQWLRGKARKVIGLDVDDAGANNPGLDEFVRLTGDSLPLPDGSVNLCIAHWVAEHLDDPERSFSEVFRVLAPNGVFCIRTPNLLHYASIAAALTPSWLHPVLHRFAGHRMAEADMFPTRYRCNLRTVLHRHLTSVGFDSVVLRHRCTSLWIGRGKLMGLWGKWVEEFMPPLFWHELHAFARKPDAIGTTAPSSAGNLAKAARRQDDPFHYSRHLGRQFAHAVPTANP